MLYSGTGGLGNQSDSYKTAVVDTIVAEVQSVPGEDRCVLLLGYKEQIETMFRNVNPGLSRRYDIFQMTLLGKKFVLIVPDSRSRILSILRISMSRSYWRS